MPTKDERREMKQALKAIKRQKMNTRKEKQLVKFARQVHAKAEKSGHEIVWRVSPEGYIGKCLHDQCRIVITVEDDGKPNLIQSAPFPKCPLCTTKHDSTVQTSSARRRSRS